MVDPPSNGLEFMLRSQTAIESSAQLALTKDAILPCSRLLHPTIMAMPSQGARAYFCRKPPKLTSSWRRELKVVVCAEIRQLWDSA